MSIESPKSNEVSVGTRGDAGTWPEVTTCSEMSSDMDACLDTAAARLAAFAFAICSLSAAEDFRAVAAAGDTVDSAVMVVLVSEVTEAPDLKVPEREVADDVCEADDTFLGVSEAPLLLRDGRDGFLRRPVTGALALVGRAANVFAPYFKDGVACAGAGLSGLGVFERDIRELPGDFRVPDTLVVVPPKGVLDNGVWKDPMLRRPLEGVP